MKKLIIFALVIVMIAAVFAGCGSSDDDKLKGTDLPENFNIVGTWKFTNWDINALFGQNNEDTDDLEKSRDFYGQKVFDEMLNLMENVAVIEFAANGDFYGYFKTNELRAALISASNMRYDVFAQKGLEASAEFSDLTEEEINRIKDQMNEEGKTWAEYCEIAKKSYESMINMYMEDSSLATQMKGEFVQDGLLKLDMNGATYKLEGNTLTLTDKNSKSVITLSYKNGDLIVVDIQGINTSEGSSALNIIMKNLILKRTADLITR